MKTVTLISNISRSVKYEQQVKICSLLILILKTTMFPALLSKGQCFLESHRVLEFTDSLEHVTTGLTKFGHCNARR